MSEAKEEADEGDEEEAEEESYCYEFDGGFGVDGLNGRRRSCGGGFFDGGLGCGLGGGVGLEGGAVARDYLLAVAVGGEACGVASLVGLDEDGGGFTNGVEECEGDGLNHGVVDGFIVGLMRDGPAAFATHCKQGKRRYEGSR